MSDLTASSAPATPVTDPLFLRYEEKPLPVNKPQQLATLPVKKPASLPVTQAVNPPVQKPAEKPQRLVKKLTARPTADQRIIADLRLNNATMHKQIGNMVANWNQLSSILITKTHRIRATVRCASDIYRTLHQFAQVKTLMTSEELTIEKIQEILSPLITLWTTALTEEDFLPYKCNTFTPNMKLPRARPVFLLSNLLPYLAPKENSYSLKPEFPNLVHRYCTSIFQDCQSFPYLRAGHSFPTVWQAYLAIVATITVFNLNKSKPVRYYPPFLSAHSCVDFDDSNQYKNAVSRNLKDLDFEASPPPLRQHSEYYSIIPKKRSQNPGTDHQANNKRRKN